jgi:hypothetical protein
MRLLTGLVAKPLTRILPWQHQAWNLLTENKNLYLKEMDARVPQIMQSELKSGKAMQACFSSLPASKNAQFILPC